jgi:hypothetical protein
VPAGAEAGHVDAGFGDGVLGGAAAPAGHRFCLGQLLLMRGQQPFDHPGQPGDLRGDPVDALQHDLQQRRVLRREELRALQRFLQLGDLAAGAGAGAGQLGQRLRVALPGDQVIHDVPAGHPVQVADHR